MIIMNMIIMIIFLSINHYVLKVLQVDLKDVLFIIDEAQ